MVISSFSMKLNYMPSHANLQWNSEYKTKMIAASLEWLIFFLLLHLYGYLRCRNDVKRNTKNEQNEMLHNKHRDQIRKTFWIASHLQYLPFVISYYNCFFLSLLSVDLTSHISFICRWLEEKKMKARSRLFSTANIKRAIIASIQLRSICL